MANRTQPKRKTAQVSAAPAVPEEEIAQMAYMLFERRGGVPGHDMEDWLEAERMVSARRRAPR